MSGQLPNCDQTDTENQLMDYTIEYQVRMAVNLIGQTNVGLGVHFGQYDVKSQSRFIYQPDFPCYQCYWCEMHRSNGLVAGDVVSCVNRT